MIRVSMPLLTFIVYGIICAMVSWVICWWTHRRG